LNELKSIIESKIRDIELPYVISFGILLSFEKDNIDEFIDFIKSLGNPSLNTYEFNKNDLTLAQITFLKKSDKCIIASRNSAAREFETAGRIKFKLLDKSKQLPKVGYNIIIIKLNDHSASDIDMDQAFNGQRGINIATKEQFIKDNGFVHDDKSDDVAMAISYKSVFSKRRLYLNDNAKNQIDIKMMEIIRP
jgi:hypothetical protein